MVIIDGIALQVMEAVGYVDVTTVVRCIQRVDFTPEDGPADLDDFTAIGPFAISILDPIPESLANSDTSSSAVAGDTFDSPPSPPSSFGDEVNMGCVPDNWMEEAYKKGWNGSLSPSSPVIPPSPSPIFP